MGCDSPAPTFGVKHVVPMGLSPPPLARGVIPFQSEEAAWQDGRPWIASSIQSHPASDRTLPVSDSNRCRYAVTASTFPQGFHRPCIPTHLLTSSNTRSAGLSSGLYAGCVTVGRPTVSTSRLRCPRAPSHTSASISVPRFSPLTAAAIRSAFIESIPLHNSLPRRPSTTQNRYIHSYAVCTRLTHLHSTTTPYPARRSTKTNSHLVGKAQYRLFRHSRFAERLAKSPFSRTPALGGQPFSWSPRGSLGEHPSLASRLYTLPGV